MRGAFGEPLGILTHHLVHDDAAWDFLDWFVAYASKRFDWRSASNLFGAPVTRAANPLFPSRIGASKRPKS